MDRDTRNLQTIVLHNIFEGCYMPEKNIQITHANASDLAEVIHWVEKEGWNPGLHDAQTFYQADPQAFFIGKVNGTLVAMASATIYDDTFAFFGFLLVKPEYRAKGYGLAITQARLNYVGDRTVGLDGVVDMQAAYQTNRFYLAHRNFRYQIRTKAPAKKNQFIIPLAQIPWNTLLDYDTKHFPVARPRFLEKWVSQPESHAYAYYQDDKLQGYALMRPCVVGYKIGPLFADTPEIAKELFMILLHEAAGQAVFIDIPETNLEGIHMLKGFDATLVFETGRMYRNHAPKLLLQTIYGLTSYEFG